MIINNDNDTENIKIRSGFIDQKIKFATERKNLLSYSEFIQIRFSVKFLHIVLRFFYDDDVY